MRTPRPHARYRTAAWLSVLLLGMGAHPSVAPDPAIANDTGRVTVWVYRSTPCLPALGVTVRLGGVDRLTNAGGAVRFEAVPPGLWSVSVWHAGRRAVAEVRVMAGEEARVALDLGI